MVSPPRKMSSLEAAPMAKRPSCSGSRSLLQRPRSRSRLARFLLFERVDYLQWVATAAAFFFVVLFFESSLPLDSSSSSTTAAWRELGGLEFGDGIRFEPTRLLERFERERRDVDPLRSRRRSGALRPRLALVVADLSVDGTQLQMVTVAVALKAMGYDIEVLALDDGPVRSIWATAGFSISILSHDDKHISIDWLNYNGVLVNSLEAKPVLTCLSQEPFRAVPVIWAIYERSLALRLEEYEQNNNTQIISNWKRAFQRPTVVAFPNHFFPMLYRKLDTGNYYVIPGSAIEVWKARSDTSVPRQQDHHNPLGNNSDDFLIAIVGSMFSYSGLLLEQALVLQAISQSSVPHLKVGILHGNLTNSYNMALEDIALKFGFSRGNLYQFDSDEDMDKFLNAAKIVLYGSFLEEQSFPPVLVQAMCLGKLIVAPDLSIISEFVKDGVNAYVFPKDNIGMLPQILAQVIFNGELSPLAKKVSSNGKELAKNLLASETIEAYAFLLNNILKLPSEVETPMNVANITLQLRKQWRWELFENISLMINPNASSRSSTVDEHEGQQSSNQAERILYSSTNVEDAFSSINWAEEKAVGKSDARKRILVEELKDRTDRYHGTWEEVYRNVKRAAARFNKLHVIDDRELERTGQPLCIYEPYFGGGTWPFLHNKSLYRGIGLSTKGRRHGVDDIDASSRLPILTDPYYRDVLGEYGAFFAVANRVDRIHRNAWIGFQSWRVTAAKASLSKKSETILLEAIESRKFGDALFFWVRMDSDPRNPYQHDFWSFCDSINAGNCRFAVSQALRRMYRIQNDWDPLPPMPADGGSWSTMHSWALPTRSFLEFVMFSRIFVDALDAEIYDEHHENSTCYLSLSKDPHCYSRVLELLVNVWAYHSARRMVYIDPITGGMQEQHNFKTRRGKMWIKWFSPATLKIMDEELAEEWDLDHPDRRWLWPRTGEVFWHGIYERERAMGKQKRERHKRERKKRQRRMRRKTHQKALGKYILPPPENAGDGSNTTISEM